VLHEAAHAGLSGETLRELASEWDAVLGLGLIDAVVTGTEAPIPAEVADLAARREAARKEGNYAEADALRARIREAGYDIVDIKGGQARLRKL
jgi:cysteinyl-tRNA synthetase